LVPKGRASEHGYLRLQCHPEDFEDKAPIHEQMFRSGIVTINTLSLPLYLQVILQCKEKFYDIHN